MPKEIINDQYAHPKDGDKPAPDLKIEVAWQRDHMDVEVGSTNHSADFDVRGWFVHLDRAGTNRLIRTLRRARDQAFGADA